MKNKDVKNVGLFAIFIAIVSVLIYISSKYGQGFFWGLSLYAVCMLSYLLIKVILSFRYEPVTSDDVLDYDVSVVVPFYNEKIDSLLATIKSILNQDYPIKELIVVDDGSDTLDGYNLIKKIEAELINYKETGKYVEIDLGNIKYIPKFIINRFEENQGKRIAQIWAFENSTGNIICTSDSDSYIESDGIRELLKPLVDKDVYAVTGHINAKNREESLLTKLIDMRYENAFRVERAAQSTTNNILVCSGPMSCYRREVIMDNIDNFREQKFLGNYVQYGDDRCLTNYAIKYGKTVYQSTAKCLTDVPTSLLKYVKQQVRWTKSFYRESLISLKFISTKPAVFLWTLSELALTFMFFISFCILIYKNVFYGSAMLLMYYFGCTCLSAWARNVYYVIKRPVIYLLAPVYGLIHLIFITPIKIFALLTLKVSSWGTR